MHANKIVLTLAIIAIALGGFYIATKGSHRSLNEPVSLVASKNLWTSVPIIASKQGFFAEEGLDVSIEYVQAARFAMDAVVSGTADFGTVVEINLAYLAFSGNEDIRLISTIVKSFDSGIIARQDSGISSPSDLEGKRLGVLTGTTSEIFADRFLDANGVDKNGISIQSLQPVAMQTALVERNIDAASVWHPFIYNIAKAVGDENVVIFKDPTAYTGYMNIATSADFLNEKPGVAARFLRAQKKALEFIRSNPSEAQEIVAREIDLDIEIVRAIWDEYEFLTELDVDGLTIVLENEANWIRQNSPENSNLTPNFQWFFPPNAE